MNNQDLYSSIITRSESWIGSYVPYANKKLSSIEIMLDKYFQYKYVIAFLKYSKKYYESKRDREKVRDEERDLL